MTRERLRIIQTILEGLIPLLGFFLWNWTIHFVLLFYMLDLLADHVFLHLGSRRIVAEQKIKSSNALKQGLLSTLFLGFALLLIHLALILIFPELQLWESMIDFWTYKEMGLEQGYLLLPLVVLAAQQQYKMEFLMPARYRIISLRDHWKKANLGYVIIAAFSGLAIGLSIFIELPATVYLLSIVVVSTVYRLLFS